MEPETEHISYSGTEVSKVFLDERDLFLCLLILEAIDENDLVDGMNAINEEDPSYIERVGVNQSTVKYLIAMREEFPKDVYNGISRISNGALIVWNSGFLSLYTRMEVVKNAYLSVDSRVRADVDYDPYKYIRGAASESSVFTLLTVLGYPPSEEASGLYTREVSLFTVSPTVPSGEEILLQGGVPMSYDVENKEALLPPEGYERVYFKRVISPLPSTHQRIRRAIIHILRIPYLHLEQWSELIHLRFNFCISPEVCTEAVSFRDLGSSERTSTEAVSFRDLGSSERTGTEARIIEGIEVEPDILCDPLSKMLLNITYNVVDLPVDDLIELLTRSECSRLGIQLGEKINYLIEDLKIRKHIGRERTGSVRASTIDNAIVRLNQIKNAIDTMRNKAKYTSTLQELSIQPVTGRFPGGSEYRLARQRLTTMASITPQEIEYIRSRGMKWEDIITLLSKTGILPFSCTCSQGTISQTRNQTENLSGESSPVCTREDIDVCKENALSSISVRVYSILERLNNSRDIEEIFSIARQFNVRNVSTTLNEAIQTIYQAIISWSQAINTSLDWRTIIQIMNGLGITSIPDTPEGIVNYLQAYITQY